jgi:hypothetical protein
MAHPQSEARPRPSAFNRLVSALPNPLHPSSTPAPDDTSGAFLSSSPTNLSAPYSSSPGAYSRLNDGYDGALTSTQHQHMGRFVNAQPVSHARDFGARYHVAGAAPLLGLASAPAEVVPPGTRVAVVGRSALRILQLASAFDSDENIGRLANLRPEMTVEEKVDVRQGSRLGRTYGMNDVKWGYGGQLQAAHPSL